MDLEHGHETDTVDGVHVSALGLVIQMRFDEHLDEELRRKVAEAWSGATVSATESGATVDVMPGGSPEQVLEYLSTQVTLAALQASQGEFLTFHAAGVALEDGRVIAFVGASGQGKTTLARTLGKDYGYVSDETIAVDAAMEVHPYRKPLSVVQHQGPKLQVAPDAAGLLNLPDAPLRLAALVLLDRDPDATDLVIERVPLLLSIIQLLPETSYTASLDAPLERLATLCEGLGGVQRITYHDASVLSGAIEQLLQPCALDERWTLVREVLSAGDGLQLGNISDAIECSSEVAVFSDQTLRILGGVAPAIWHGVRAGKAFDEVVQVVVEEHGLPDEGDPAALVNAAIDDLVAEGLLCRSE